MPADNDHDVLDPKLESLLDAALAVAPPAELADRIVAATQPLVSAAGPTVLARIGSTVMGLAAVLALAVGAAAWLAMMDQPLEPGVESRLAELEVIDAGRDADIDEQITLLALQIDLAERDDWWAPADEGLDRATLQYQLEALSSDPAIF